MNVAYCVVMSKLMLTLVETLLISVHSVTKTSVKTNEIHSHI